LEEAAQRRAIFGWKLLQDDERCSYGPGMSYDRAGEGLREGATRRFIGGIEVPFAGRTTDHQRPHAHEARPQSADELSKHPDTGTGTLKKILVEQETGLDRSHRSAGVLDDKVAIVEALLDRVLDDLVVAMVFALRRKGLLPTGTTRQLGP